jgi:hypothetical protein
VCILIARRSSISLKAPHSQYTILKATFGSRDGQAFSSSAQIFRRSSIAHQCSTRGNMYGADMKPDNTDDQKIKGAQPDDTQPSSGVNEAVEDAAASVGKPASEPVERTAELLNQELEVSKAGIASPEKEEHRPAR